MIPIPSGSASSCRAGKGLIMSSRRKSRNASSASCGVNGRNSSDAHMPATSSTTTIPGSLRPSCRATLVEASTPTADSSTVAASCQRASSVDSGTNNASPTAVPAVPGANGE